MEREWGARPAPGASGPRGGRTLQGTQGAPWAPWRPPPLLRLERFQSRGAATLFSALGSAILPLLLLLLLQLLVLLLLLLSPSAAAPAAGSSSPSLPLSLSTLSLLANFPVPWRAAQSFPCSLGPTADRGLPARLCLVSHLCALACSGENGTMPGDGDRGAARARWLGTGLLGKAVPAWSLLLPLSPRYPLRRGGGT